MKKLLLILLFLSILSSCGESGCISGDCENGYGAYIWPNGDKYEGEWKDGKMDGQGTFIFPIGEEHKGGFKDGKRHGQGITKKDNNIAVGEWINDNIQQINFTSGDTSITIKANKDY